MKTTKPRHTVALLFYTPYGFRAICPALYPRRQEIKPLILSGNSRL